MVRLPARRVCRSDRLNTPRMRGMREAYHGFADRDTARTGFRVTVGMMLKDSEKKMEKP